MTAKFKYLLTLFIFITPLALSLPASAKVRVYILAGQSNMMGKGKTHKLPTAYKKQPKNVEFYYQGRQRKLAQYSHFGPEVSFAHEISRAFPNDTHIIIKHVATGSSIQQWLPGSGLFNSMLRQRGFVKVGNKLDINTIKIDAVFWMQGEADARNSHDASRYEGSLKRFITGVRNKLDSPHSLFIMGEINPEDPAFSMTKTVQKAQQKVQHSLTNVKLVSTKGLGKIFDHVHYDAAGQIELGKRFAKAYIH
jgi:hypothetical protein